MKATFSADALRPVRIKVLIGDDNRGLFHGWYHAERSSPKGSSETNLFGIIEQPDGNILFVKPADFAFLDSNGKFDKYYFGE